MTTSCLRNIAMMCLLAIGGVCFACADDTTRTIKLPERYSQFTYGGAGRYIVFHLASKNRAVVYDVVRDEFTLKVDEVAEGDLLAASREKLLVVSPSKMLLRRWDFASGKRDKLALIDGNDAPRDALLGSAGSGPLLLIGQAASRFFDLDSLKPMQLKGPMIGGRGRYGLAVHVSAAGRTFGTIPVGYGPVGFAIYHIEGQHVTQVPFGSTSNAIRWAQPSCNGYLVMQPAGGVVTRLGREIKADWLKGAALIPSPDPRYVLDVRLDHQNEEKNRTGKITVCATADCRPLISETGFDELVPRQLVSWHDIVGALRMGHQWRVQFLPAENLLITLPASNDRMILRQFDLKEKLRATAEDYLFVDSIPPLLVVRGTTLNYQIQAQSGKKKFRVTLEDGPAGAKLVRKGKLQWRVPSDYSESWARFVLSVSSSSNNEVFHSFEVAVQTPSAAGSIDR